MKNNEKLLSFIKDEITKLEAELLEMNKYDYDYEYMFDMELYTYYDLAKKVDEKKELKYYKKYGNDGTSPYY